MKTKIESIRQTGYGQWKVTIRYSNGKYYSAHYTDAETIDGYRENNLFYKKDFIKQRRAEKSIIRWVKRDNNLK